MSTSFETVPLFATPILMVEVADAAVLNAALREVIGQRRTTHPGTADDWQSERDMDRWGGAPAIKLLAIARNTATRATTDRQGQPAAVTWRAAMWATVDRLGHGGEFHSHPGSFWSGIYYVDDGGIDADPTLGGELEFMDPRGPGPAMYAPQFGFGSAGLSAGANETIRPRAGRLLLFPAWLLHQVRPCKAAAERISIAFNLSL